MASVPKTSTTHVKEIETRRFLSNEAWKSKCAAQWRTTSSLNGQNSVGTMGSIFDDVTLRQCGEDNLNNETYIKF